MSLTLSLTKLIACLTWASVKLPLLMCSHLHSIPYLLEPQVRSIANHVRPDRQSKLCTDVVANGDWKSTSSALLFSATFRKKVERLCRDVLTDPVRIVVGGVGEANEDITQVVEVMDTDQEKWAWLLKHLVEFTSSKLTCCCCR